MTETEILSDEQLKEIEAHFHLTTDGDAVFVLSRAPALCQTVRALRERIANLTAEWCECGHAKAQHNFFSDHDECYECDQASPDLCCEWRPAPRTVNDTATTMRSRCVETIRNLRPSATGAGAFKDAAIKALESLPLEQVEQEK